MDRPKIKDKAVLAYVEDLERQLESFKTDNTAARMYLAVKKQADDLAKLISNDVEIEIPMENGEVKVEKKPFMDFQTLSSKDDKFFDRYEKLLKLWRPLMKDLKEAELEINPEIIEKEEHKLIQGSVVERYLKQNAESQA